MILNQQVSKKKVARCRRRGASLDVEILVGGSSCDPQSTSEHEEGVEMPERGRR